MMSRLTTGDKVMAIGSLFLIAASYLFANAVAGPGAAVLIDVDGKTVYKTMLQEEHVFTVEGVQGRLTVETHGGKVAVIDADCPNHVCVKTGWRSRSGEVIVCVPNKTVVRIVSHEAQGVRATTG